MPEAPTPTPSEQDVQLAQELLAEWNEGNGSSKSEIERRVWSDGGAHGRRFDRFIRQTLGVATTQRSKQSDRIGELERQLLRAGVTPVGKELSEWESQLHHGRQAALAALRAWNDPTSKFRTETFALLFVTAWNSIAIAILQRSGAEWREFDDKGQPVLDHGLQRSASTGALVSSAFGSSAELGLRRNIEFWLGLRNQVAHRHLPALDVAIIPQAQAGLLNLEGVLEKEFGRDYQLAELLSVPLQLSGFRDPGVTASLKTLVSSLPLDVQTYLAHQEEVNEDLLDDPSYMLRVTFLPAVPSSGRNPDVVAYFVRPGEVTEELSQALKDYHVLPKVVRAERPHLIATQVVTAVADRIDYRFTMTMHTAAARNLEIRPPSSDSDQSKTDPRYCEYVTSVNRHLYNQAWVERLVSELSTEEGFRAATGFEPRPR